MEFKLLDHGYLKVVEHWGSDEAIICAARMSTSGSFRGWGPKHEEDCLRPDLHFAECCCDGPVAGDEKLLRYLYENKHSTPFEMAGLVVEVKCPIFVLREWHRHRTQSYSEMSARYTPLPDENYIPTVERLMMNSKTNKQAGTIKGSEELTEEQAEGFRSHLVASYGYSEKIYQAALREGVPKELARIHLPVARYSKMRASANLRNWLGFLTLRMDTKSQYEIRVYAEAVGQIIKNLFPRTWELFAEGNK